MKRLKNWVKNNIKLIAVMVVGLFISTVTSYGANQLESSSVSYTKKDGQLTTVKSALDELINKSLSRIGELEEQVNDYEKGVHYLADVANVGEYVIYDAGNWNETKEKPTSDGQFGGYTINTSKNLSSTCSGSMTLKGWRVLSKNEKTKTVTIVHAGIPECYYHGTDSNDSVNKLNTRANNYKNSYAQSAHGMTLQEALTITDNLADTSNDLNKTGRFYWLASSCSNSNNESYDKCIDGDFGKYSDTALYSVYPSGLLDDNYINGAFVHLGGFRPVVELKAKILTTGQGKDMFDQKAWTLVP